jgi:putative membrane protein
MNPGWKKFIKSWLINTFAVLVAVVLLRPHIQCQGVVEVFVAALLLGVLNTFIRPIMLLLALPLLIVTLGLFMIVINACLLYLVKAMMGVFGLHFGIAGFGWALLAALIISVVSLPLNLMTGAGTARVKVQRRQRPPDAPDGGGSGGGPVIDV